MMDPQEVILTMVCMSQHSRELEKLSNTLMREPDFKTDSELLEKHQAMLKAIREFGYKLGHKD